MSVAAQLPMSACPMPEYARRELEAVRAMADSLLSNDSAVAPNSTVTLPKAIQRFLQRRLIQKPKKTRKPSHYRPRDAFDETWKSKRPHLVKQFLHALQTTPELVVERSPHIANASGLSTKCMTVKFLNIVTPYNGDRALRMCNSLSIVDACARLVEIADQLKREQPARFHDARLVMQQSHDSPGWRTRSTTGTGLAFNHAAELELLPLAIAKVEEQLCDKTTASTPPSPPASTDEDEGSSDSS